MHDILLYVIGLISGFGFGFACGMAIGDSRHHDESDFDLPHRRPKDPDHPDLPPFQL